MRKNVRTGEEGEKRAMKKGAWGLVCLLALAVLLLGLPAGALAQESRAVTGEDQLVAGEVYWFDLSSMEDAIYDYYTPPGDIKLVPAVYTGTMYAYVLNENSVGKTGSSWAAANTTDPSGPYGYIYNHSLFVMGLSTVRSWDAMNEEDLIFGRKYVNNGVTYTMRAPTGGSAPLGTAGTPPENEFACFQQYMKKLAADDTWINVQDSLNNDPSQSVRRTLLGAEFGFDDRATQTQGGSYMPVLELQDGDLSVLTYDLNGGRYDTRWPFYGDAEDGYFTYLKLVRDAGVTVKALNLGFGTNNNLKPSSFAKFTGWLGDDGYTYWPGDTVPASVTRLTAQWEIPGEQYTSLAVGEEYWFDLSGVNKTNQTLNPALPDNSLTWMPFVYMGTVNAYVLNENSDGVTEASDQASQTEDSSAEYGYTYEHSLFLSRNYLFQNTSATWNDLKGKGLIFGTDMLLGGISYRLRAPSGGNDWGSYDPQPENNEWSLMRTKAKAQTFFDAIQNPDCNAMMQDTEKVNGASHYYSRQWQSDFASQSSNKNNKNNGYYTPVLEIPAGADIRTVTVNLGGGSVGGNSTLKLAVSADGFTAPKTQGISGMSGTLVWQGDNGAIYNPGDVVPDTVQTLTLCTELAITGQPSSATVVQGTTARFTVTAQGAVGYQWQVNDGSGWKDVEDGSGMNEAAYTTPETTLDMNGWKYRCVVTGAYEEANSSEATLTVNPAEFEIAVSAQGDGTANGGGTVKYGDSVTVTAAADAEKAHFTIWQENGQTVSTDASYTFTATADRTLVAVFEAHTGDWQSDGDEHFKTCPVCGAEYARGAHAGGSADDCLHKKVCDTCQLEYGEAGPHPLTEHPAVAATCTGDGNVQYWGCSVCGRTFADASAATELTDVVLPALGHDWQLSAWTWSTDYANASARFACARDASHTDSAAAVVSSQTTDPDCVSDGQTVYTARATFDGQSYEDSRAVTLPATGHNWDTAWQSDAAGHWHECLNANCPVTGNAQKDGYAAHEPQGGGDCTQSVICGVCGYVITPAQGGHSFTNYVSNGDATCTEDGTETAVCDHAGCTVTDTRTVAGSVLGHAYRDEVTPPTCTEQGFTTHICDRCGDTYVDAYTDPAGHKWGAWQENAHEHWQVCTVCGEETGRGEHEYTGDEDTDCDVCGHVRTVITPDVAVRVVRSALTAVPDGLKDTPFATVPAIEGELSRVLLTGGYTAGKMAFYDVTLQYSTDGGVSWVNATADNFPATGITVTLPYPEGTGKELQDFAVSHMFTVTSDRLGTVAGGTETPAAVKTDAGIQVTLRGLSPVAVAWKENYDAGCELVFEVNGGEPLASLRLPYETNVDLTDYTPVRPGYDFAGWYADAALTRKIESVQLLDHSTTVYAAWDTSIVPPQTGDNTPVGLWMLLMLVSLGCLSLLALNRRRQSGER